MDNIEIPNRINNLAQGCLWQNLWKHIENKELS